MQLLCISIHFTSNIKWQWIFYFLRRCFLSSITATTVTGLYRIYMYELHNCYRALPYIHVWVTRRVSYMKLEMLINYLSGSLPTVFWWGPYCLFKKKMVLSYYVSTFRVPCCYVRYDFRLKTMFGLSLPLVVCKARLVSYLRYLCFVYA